MTKVFIGGSRRIGRLPDDVQTRIDHILDQQLPILVGDANGVDKAVQLYLHAKHYPKVEVFCSRKECRNNHGQWPIRFVSFEDVAHHSSDFYAMEDTAMTLEAAVGIMIWDGKSKGTRTNVFHMLSYDKSIAVYVAPARQFIDITTLDDWEHCEALVSDLPTPPRPEEQRPRKPRRRRGDVQLALF